MNDELNSREVRARARVIMLDRAWKVFVVVFLGCIFTLLAVSYLSSLAARREIRDCSVPTGACYQDQQRRGQELVKSLLDRQTDSLIIAVNCARREEVTTDQALENCVRAEIKKQNKETSK